MIVFASMVKDMRLIDVDKFLECEGERIKMQGREDSYYSINFLTSRYEVKAIPIEWLDSWLKTEGMDMTFNKLIYDWRKENDRTNE